MMKHILVAFVLGVVLREASADIECFLNAVGGGVMLPSDENVLCKGYVDTLRGHLKTCEVTKVNLDKLESYVKDICTPGSEIKKDMDASQKCFMDHIGDAVKCVPQINPKDSITGRMKAVCKKRHDIYSCMKKNLGEPCGKAGLNVMTKGQDAEESYVKDICALVGGAAVNSIFMWLLVLCVSFTMLKSH